MSSFPLRLPDDLKEVATAQAEAAGVSLNQYIATALAARVGAQAETERYFAARAARATPERAREILGKGRQGQPAHTGRRVGRRRSPGVTATPRFVAYYRVSTSSEAAAGLVWRRNVRC